MTLMTNLNALIQISNLKSRQVLKALKIQEIRFTHLHFSDAFIYF